MAIQPMGAKPATAPGATAPSPQDQALAQALAGARTRVYLNLSTAPSSAITTALTAAIARGLDVKVVLVPKRGFDATWVLQQRLESSGAEVDVRDADPLPGVWAVIDDAGLSPSGQPLPAAAVGSATKQLQGLFTPVSPTVPPPILSRPDQVLLHPMPESSNAWLVLLLRRAKSSIDLEIYQLEDPAVTDALKAAARRGLKVRVMLEPKTVGAQNFAREAAELKAAGIDVQATPPQFDSAHNVDHAKLMVIDGQELVFGTGNLVRSGLGGDTDAAYDNRDFWVEDTRAQSIREAEALFQADWARQDTSADTFSNLVVTPDNADPRLLQLIDGTTSRLYVYNQELVDAQVLQHLIAAKRRGVDVQVLLGYQPGFGGPPPNKGALDQLRAAGVKAAYLRQSYLHAKGIVSDGRAFLGSQNFSAGGLMKNREVGEILQGPLVDELAGIFLKDMGASTAAPP